jgi:exopolyphosphatase/guanosine-5'-triphosphate,3'-diphosphate pyrophosphatase
MLRVVYLFSASMPGVVHNLTFRRSDSPELDLEFVVPKSYEEFAGERLDGRLMQLSKLTGKRLAFVYE